MVLFQSRVVGSVSSESAAAPATNPAAAELDHFSLREKIGTRTVLAESPGLVASAKHGLIDSGGRELAATSYRVLKKMIKRNGFVEEPNAREDPTVYRASPEK